MTDPTDREDVCRRAFLAGLVALPLGACGTDDFYGQTGRQLWRSVVGDNSLPLPNEEIAALGIPVLAARVGSGRYGLLGLHALDDDALVWRSEDDRFLAMRSGRLVRTAGFATDLAAVRMAGPDLLAIAPHRIDRPVHSQRTIDLRDKNDFRTLALDAEIRPKGEELIDVLGQEIAVVRLEERARARGLRWRVDATFWVDRVTGFVWKSHQEIDDGFGQFRLRVLRRPFA